MPPIKLPFFKPSVAEMAEELAVQASKKAPKLSAEAKKEIENTRLKDLNPQFKEVTAPMRSEAGKKAAEYVKKQPQIKMSEALGNQNIEGKKKIRGTITDRTAVGKGNIGGALFPTLGLVDENYKDNAWGVRTKGAATTLLNQNDADTIWTTILGGSDQLKSNPIVFERMKKKFINAINKGAMSPELAEAYNKRLVPLFGEGADIRDPELWKLITTFDQRAAVGDLMLGKQTGGKKGQIFDVDKLLRDETEPSLLHPDMGGNVDTYEAGPRLFTFSGEQSYRPDVHSGFPQIVHGEDLDVNVKPTPSIAVFPQWHKQFLEEIAKENIKKEEAGKAPRKAPIGYMDYVRGLKGVGMPVQEINEEFLTELQKLGFKKGGSVKPSLDDMNYALNKKAGGGLIEKLVSGLVKPQTFKAVKAGDTVSGMLVRPDIPNKSSIGASLYEYSTHGVQEVPMSAFTVKGKPKYRNKEQENYTKDLAQQIKENKELNPLIVIKDKEGHYVLEGAHRFDALRELGIESFPALMVHDLESLPNEEINPDATKKNGGMVKMAGGGNVESDSSLPLQAHLRRFTTPDYLDAQDIGVTGRYGDNAITLGRQIMSKNELDENPNMRYRQSMDYGQYSTPFHEGQLNARVMKDPQRPDLQAMLQYLQSVGKGTAGVGVIGNRTSEGDKLRALSLMYGQPIDENSSINGMASIPFGGSPAINVQYNRRFADGGDVKKMHPALEKLVEEYVTNKQPNPARQTINEQLGRETLKQPFPEHRATLNPKPTVGLGAGLNLEGNKAMPSSQMELFKRKGGAVSIDEMKYALTRKI